VRARLRPPRDDRAGPAEPRVELRPAELLHAAVPLRVELRPARPRPALEPVRVRRPALPGDVAARRILCAEDPLLRAVAAGRRALDVPALPLRSGGGGHGVPAPDGGRA